MATALLPQRSRKTISLTALIDVVFILLMFFMLTSSFTQWRAIALNPATAAIDNNPAESALIIVHSDSRLSLDDVNGNYLTSELLRKNIPSDRDTVLLPRANTSVQTLLGAMTQLKQAGFDKLTLGESLPTDSDTR